jgi:hypothetical protein
LKRRPIGLIDWYFGMSVDLGWIIYVGIDTSFEYIFEEFGFSVFAVRQSGKIDIEKCGANYQPGINSRDGDLHVPKVE